MNDPAPAAPPGRLASGRRPVVAIDGPAASGKTTLGAALAARLGCTYFDSGVIYRVLTWLARQRGVLSQDAPRLTQLARQMDLKLLPPTVDDGRQYTVEVDGEDATWAIRTPEVDREVSTVSAHPGVRAALIDQQRRLAATGGIVMVGRDIGTVVLPHADLKLYVTASVEERARRRVAELRARGQPADYEQILGEMRRRDAQDAGRTAAPMRPAADAVHLSTDALSIDEEVEFALRRLEGRR